MHTGRDTKKNAIRRKNDAIRTEANEQNGDITPTDVFPYCFGNSLIGLIIAFLTLKY
jgi:hypothetical protein